MNPCIQVAVEVVVNESEGLYSVSLQHLLAYAAERYLALPAQEFLLYTFAGAAMILRTAKQWRPAHEYYVRMNAPGLLLRIFLQ